MHPVEPGDSFDSDPTVDPDQLVLVFTRESAATKGDLHVAVRPDPDSPFGTPRRLPTINTTSKEDDGELSADGCELFFTSNRVPGGDALYVARAAN